MASTWQKQARKKAAREEEQCFPVNPQVSEIESLASRTSFAALQLRFA